MKAVRALAALTAVLVAGCATTAVSLSVLQHPGREVRAEVSKFSILWLSPITLERARELLDDLNEQCVGTGVTGVTTKTSSTWVLIGQIEKVEVSGYCIEP